MSISDDVLLRLPQRRILVVDDNRSAAYLLSHLLISLRQTVESAHSGAAALQLLSTFQPDAVISDIAMPDISGLDLARAIRANPSLQQPVLVALSGYTQHSDQEAAVAAGFDLHLIKPVSLEQLVKLLVDL